MNVAQETYIIMLSPELLYHRNVVSIHVANNQNIAHYSNGIFHIWRLLNLC